MKDIGNRKCISSNILLVFENLVIDFENSNELRFNDLLIRDVIGVTKSILAIFFLTVTCGKTIARARWNQGDRNIAIPYTLLVLPIHMLLNLLGQVRFLFLYTSVRCI